MSARLPIPPESKAGDSQSEIAACQAGFSICNQAGKQRFKMFLATHHPGVFVKAKVFAISEIKKDMGFAGNRLLNSFPHNCLHFRHISSNPGGS